MGMEATEINQQTVETLVPQGVQLWDLYEMSA
jgi:hypothetical protein